MTQATTPPPAEAPAIAPEAPAITPEAPAITPEAPAIAPEAPAIAPEAPAIAPEAPAIAPEAPAIAPEAPSPSPAQTVPSPSPAQTVPSPSPAQTASTAPSSAQAAPARAPAPPVMRQCEECGKRGTGLRRCSRCKAAWFCDERCQRRNWDVHRHSCEVHEIADSVEARGDDQLAEWMRTKNRKVGVVTRGDQPVQYGRLPRPPPPEPTAEELAEVAKRKAERAARPFAERQREVYEAFEVTDGFGLANDRFRWTQTQHNVCVAVPLPEGVAARELHIVLGPDRLSVTRGQGDAAVVLLQGELQQPIKAEESAWELDRESGVLTLSLLKRWRSGNYAAGTTNADTWWPSLFKDSEHIQLRYPPTEYYSAPKEDA